MSETENARLLSIIIPFFNNEDFLGDSLESLLRQVGDDIEIVLIDDGSTDRSVAVAQRVLDRYPHPHVTFVTQQNGGIANARNVGLQHASGQYVTFLDGDDLLSHHYLSTLRPLLRSGRYELIDFKYHIFKDTPPKDLSPAEPAFSASDFTQGISCLTPLFSRSMWHLWNRVFHRSLLIGESFEPGRRYEDVIFTPFFYFKTRKIGHINHELYFYRDNSLGITRNVKEKDIEDMLFAMQKMLNFAKQHSHDNAIKQLAALMVLNCFNEVKAMSRKLYGYYFYPEKIQVAFRQAALLCNGTAVPRKKVRQMQYAYIDTWLSKIRWMIKK